MKRGRGIFFALGIPFAAAALGGCQATPPAQPVAPAAVASTIPADAIVGRWGLASYQKEADRARTTAAARAQCGKPYIIEKGQSGGVIMHVADDPQPQELFLKGSADGKTFIGPPGDAGGISDREIVSFEKDVFVTHWVDPEVAGRYGTMVYVRCGAK
jgi:hypothetical protein